MNRFLLLLFFALTSLPTSVRAQSQKQQEEIQKLVLRVDSLEHELSVFRQGYEINMLNTKLTIFENEVSDLANSIQIYIFHRNSDSKMGEAYQRLYESKQGALRAYRETSEQLKKLFVLQLVAQTYKESDFDYLKSCYNVTDKTFDSIESSMELLKLAIDEYLKHV